VKLIRGMQNLKVSPVKRLNERYVNVMVFVILQLAFAIVIAFELTFVI